MPTFRCAKCLKTLNRLSVYNSLSAAMSGNAARDTSTPPMPNETAEPVATPLLTETTNETQLDWASQMTHEDTPSTTPTLRFEHHEAVPEFMQKLLDELNDQRRRLDKHDQLYEENRRLQQQLTEANSRVTELEHELTALRQQIHSRTPPLGTMVSIHAPNLDATEFPEIDTPHVNQVRTRTNDSGIVWNQVDRTQKLRRSLRTTTNIRTQEAAARAFVLPSATHGF
ncbi:hypothetical protein DFQ28_003891, partial [Apophysomyces sp. BC1034]